MIPNYFPFPIILSLILFIFFSCSFSWLPLTSLPHFPTFLLDLKSLILLLYLSLWFRISHKFFSIPNSNFPSFSSSCFPPSLFFLILQVLLNSSVFLLLLSYYSYLANTSPRCASLLPFLRTLPTKHQWQAKFVYPQKIYLPHHLPSSFSTWPHTTPPALPTTPSLSEQEPEWQGRLARVLRLQEINQREKNKEVETNEL